MSEKVKAMIPGVRITPMDVSGEPAEDLLRTAEDLDAKVIVVGNKRVLDRIAREDTAHAHRDVYVAYTQVR